KGVAMAEPTDPPSGKPLVLRVEISAEGGGTLSVPALEAGLRAFADRPKPVEPPHTPDRSVVAELTQRESELERRQARLDETELTLYVGELQGELSKREPGWFPAADRPLRHH